MRPVLSVFIGRSDPFELKFELLDSPLAEAWSQLIQKALSETEIRDQHQFHNFPTEQSSQAALLKEIRLVLREIELVRPEYSFVDFYLEAEDSRRLQENLNVVHREFADQHAIQLSLPKGELLLWQRLNDLIHRIEATLHQQRYLDKYGLLNSLVLVPFKNRPSQQIPKEAFQQASMNRDFGGVYLNYPIVGRHFVELAGAKDHECPPDQFKPFVDFCADFNIYLGPRREDAFHSWRMKDLESWFFQNEDYFTGLGYSWDVAQLGIGHHKVAQIIELHLSPAEIQQRIAEKPFLHSIRYTLPFERPL